MKCSTNPLTAKIAVLILSICLVVTFSFTGSLTSFVYAGTNGGVKSAEEVDLMISLSEDMTGLEVSIPVNVSKEELQAALDAKTVTLDLVRDKSKEYLEEEMFPFQKDGGELSTWQTQNKTDMFTNVEMKADGSGDAAKLVVTMDSNCYFYSKGKVDYSAPHSGGGAYLDICGYFDLKAMNGEAELGKATAKVTPYLNFHTMKEVYEDIDALAAYDTDRYVKKESMGKSTAGRDMPYLIVAKDEKTVSDWLDYCELAETDPDAALAKIKSGDIKDIKVPVLYSNIHSNEVAAVDGILDFAWKLVKEDTIDYKYLEGFTEEGKAQFEKEAGEKGAEGSMAIPDLVKDSATYLGWLTEGKGISGKVDMAKYYNISENTYDVDKILEDVFFIIVPEENVDGRAQDTREAANGFDLNRDNSFQVTPETANMQKMIGTYNPVSVTEFHGRVTAFQCEPCDPPHEPNFEYDQLAKNLIPGGEAIGNAAVANNPTYNSYVIPQRDYLIYTGEKTAGGEDETYWADPWDDMSTSYTPQYAMLHGAVAYTVELPAYSDDSTHLVSYGIIGNSAYVAKSKASYLEAQATIFKRGVDNANSDSYDEVGQWLCDQYDVEGAEADLFRPEYNGKGENGNFYPEAYVIPVDSANQKNLQAAGDMVEYLTRNDVKVYPATKDFELDGKTYPAGTYIIPMYQAKRSVANGVLNNGTLINSWTVLYSEGITAFNKTRGFDMVCTAKPADYKVLKGAMEDAISYEEAKKGVATSFEGMKGTYVIIKNVSEDSTAAVNELLAAGKSVGLVTEGEDKGNFIVSYKDYSSVKNNYTLTAIGIDAENYNGATAVKTLKKAKVYIVGRLPDATGGFIGTNRVTSSGYVYNYDRYFADITGFETVSDPTDADVIIGGMAITGNPRYGIPADEAAINEVKAGKPYITYTSNSASNLKAVGVSGATRVGLSGAMDCLGYVEYPEETMVNATYIKEGDDILYGYNAGYFSAIPEGAKALVKTANKTPIEGFIPLTNESRKTAYETYLNGSVLGFEYTEGGYDVAAFAQTLTNKVNQRDEFAFISNFIFSRSLGEDYPGLSLSTVINDAVDMIDELQAQLDAANEAAAEAQAELEAAQAALAEAQASQDATNAEIEALKKAVADAMAAAEAAQKTADEAKAELEAAKAKPSGNTNAAKVKAAKNKTVKGLKVKVKSKKAIVTYKKTKGASAYQVQYKMAGKKWGNLAKATKKAKVTSKKLKKGKKYSFRVRTITKVGGKNVYGKWTKAKTVKIK